MPFDIEKMRYQRSPAQAPYELKDALEWGSFVRYIELGDDCFVRRQVDEYANGYLTRYDRSHWEDQFGTLADFRFGDTWVDHWAQPIVITREEFEEKWEQAAASPAIRLRNASPKEPAPWIALFESGRWKGQA